MVQHASPWFQWLPCWTFALNLLNDPFRFPDLTPHDYHRLPITNKKKPFGGYQYHTDDDIMSALDDIFLTKEVSCEPSTVILME